MNRNRTIRGRDMYARATSRRTLSKVCHEIIGSREGVYKDLKGEEVSDEKGIWESDHRVTGDWYSRVVLPLFSYQGTGIAQPIRQCSTRADTYARANGHADPVAESQSLSHRHASAGTRARTYCDRHAGITND